MGQSVFSQTYYLNRRGGGNGKNSNLILFGASFVKFLIDTFVFWYVCQLKQYAFGS